MTVRLQTLGLLLILPFALGADRPKGLGDVREVRHWSYPDYTRVVVELTRPVDPREHRLVADRKGGKPERLFLDFDGIWVGREFAKPIGVHDGLLHQVRLGQNTLTTTRLVIDLARYERHRVMRLASPDRVVVDVYGRRTQAEPSEAPLFHDGRPIRTVVLDPGHGGRDPGAIGKGGLREKDVTLRLAHELEARLKSRGFRVVLTRKQDRTVGLEERTAIAEAARGDVFVSLHANASRRRDLRGIEVYHLDKSYERHTVTVASRENHVPRGQVNPLQRAVASLRVSEASVRSAKLAHAVHGQLMDVLRARYDEVADLGVKKGPFYVLYLSSMPSILVETGFLTHRDEVRRLKSSVYIDHLAEAISRGVSDYRASALQVAANHKP